MLEANQVDGIISGSQLGNRRLQCVTAPIISFDRNLSPDIPVVSSDNYGGGVLAAQTLVKTGARSIIMITGNDNSNHRLDCAMLDLPLYSSKAPIINVSSDFSPSEKKWKSRIFDPSETRCDFCFDDLTAILVIKIAQELGISVPDELKVIGYDGTFYFIENYYPHLTTISNL